MQQKRWKCLFGPAFGVRSTQTLVEIYNSCYILSLRKFKKIFQLIYWLIKYNISKIFIASPKQCENICRIKDIQKTSKSLQLVSVVLLQSFLKICFSVHLLLMSGLDMMSAISNKEQLARLPPKPGSQLKKDRPSHLPGSRTTAYWSYDSL